MEKEPKGARFRPLDGSEIRPRGWIETWCRRDAEGITGNLDRLCPEAASGIFFDNKVGFEQRGGWSSWWNGETEGNWADAFINLAGVLGEASLLTRARNYLDRLVAAQEQDGYLGVYWKEQRFRFRVESSGEFWTQSRLLLCLLAGHRIFGDGRYLDSAVRLAERILHAYAECGQPDCMYGVPDEDGGISHGLMIIEPMLKLHQLTGRKELLAFCEKLYADYSNHGSDFPGGDARMPNLLDAGKPFLQHGPHTCEQLRIPLLLYHHTGKPCYRRAFRAGMQKLSRYMTLSGSCKSDEFIGAWKTEVQADQRGGSALVECPPLPGLGYEYCSTTELENTFMAALDLTGESQYADQLEWLVFNAAKAARRNDGKAIQYLTADNLYAATRQMGERWDYSPTHADAAVCCAPNSGKIMPAYLAGMWARDAQDDALSARLYGPCELRLPEAVITEETCYPFEMTVRFKFHLKHAWRNRLKLRIPEWAKTALFSLNGKRLQVQIEQGEDGCWAVLERSWQDGDELALQMDWQPRALRSVDGTTALGYGALLYSLDIPARGEDYQDYPLPGFHDTNYTPEAGAKWEFTLQLEKNGEPGRFVEPKFQDRQPGICEWEHPPVLLGARVLNPAAQVEQIELVPLGSTLLRRTTFPWVRR